MLKASLGLPGLLMNSHDRSKGAEPGFVVRCRTSEEGPLGGGEEAGPLLHPSIMSRTVEESADHSGSDSF